MIDAPEPGPPNAPDVKDTKRIKSWGLEEAKAEFLKWFEELNTTFGK